MSENGTLITKGLYHHPQPERFIFLKEYVIKECDGKRCLFLRCVNEIDAKIDYVELTVTEKNSRGRTIGKVRTRQKVKALAGDSFTLPEGIVLSPECADIRVSFEEAGSGYYTYREKNHKVSLYYTPKKEAPVIEGKVKKDSVSSMKKSRAIGLAVLAFILMWVCCGMSVFVSFNEYYYEMHGETWIDHVIPDVDWEAIFESIGNGISNFFAAIGGGIESFFDMLSDIDIELPEFELPDLDLFDFYW